MTSPKLFLNTLKMNKVDFFVGVPDSLLKNLSDYMSMKNCKNIITANEGTALSIAAGYNIATNKIALVYLQNSGLGNLINPLLSLTDKNVFKIPAIILVGWRGEPNTKDEPQHFAQGQVTEKIIKIIKKKTFILDGNEKNDLKKVINAINYCKRAQEITFILVKKNTFSKITNYKFNSKYLVSKERALNLIINNLNNNYRIISTTGTISRQLFELRKEKKQGHKKDLMIVGSMGHASQIALGIAMNSKKKIICIDGDGSLLMHMGGLATIGRLNLKNFIYVLLNNGCHESVGGQPTGGFEINFRKIAKACNFKHISNILDTKKKIEKYFKRKIVLKGSLFVEIRINTLLKKNLPRPDISPLKNKIIFKKYLK